MNSKDLLIHEKLIRGCENKDCQWHGPYLVEMLHFHHVDPGTKYRTKSGRAEQISDMVHRYSKTRLIEEIRKCIVLCANCHAQENERVRVSQM